MAVYRKETRVCCSYIFAMFQWSAFSQLYFRARSWWYIIALAYLILGAVIDGEGKAIQYEKSKPIKKIETGKSLYNGAT